MRRPRLSRNAALLINHAGRGRSGGGGGGDDHQNTAAPNELSLARLCVAREQVASETATPVTPVTPPPAAFLGFLFFFLFKISRALSSVMNDETVAVFEMAIF